MLLTTAAQGREVTSTGQNQIESPRGMAWEVVKPEGLPELGRWMIGPDGTPAHWLGGIYSGKKLREPINVIVVDSLSTSVEEATKRLVHRFAESGYPVRLGHSTGYQGHIGGKLYSQLPRGWDDAFADNPFELSNNHGRVFGPHPYFGSYVFIGAFSREEMNLFRWPGHQYASFNRARDDLAQKLTQKARFEFIGLVGLQNAIVDEPALTTGDHDGRAVLLRLAE
jgi:hypothetical protein